MFLLRLFRLLSFLPLRLLHGLGAGLGAVVAWISPRNRELTRENLQLAGFDITPAAALRENGRAVLELAWVWFRQADEVLGRVRVTGKEHLEAALAHGKGLIILTPHMGCFEVIAQYLASKAPLTALYRPPRKVWLKPLVEDTRGRHNLYLAPADGKGVRMMLKALKRNEAIGLLPDQVPGVSEKGGEGVWVDWFGRPAYTMTLPAKLAHATGAPIVLALALRLPKGAGYEIQFVPFTDVLSGDEAHDARSINAAIEALVARAPVQYWWSYNRYKAPRGTAPASAAEHTA
ncbi:MAG: lysophospholipid acyltransferase family protein [Burkholderiaceae bacterium]